MKMFKKFGVRGRLLLSFVGISGFAVLATVAAMYSFLLVQTLLDKVTEQRIPTALAAQELSSRVERILAETPTLLAASTPLERSQIWSRLGTEIEAIDKLLLLLRNRGFPADTLASLHNVLDSLRSNLFSLYTLVGERIVLAKRKAILLDDMLKAHEETLAVLGPWITNVKNDVQRLRTVVDDSRLSAVDRSTAETELIASLTLLASLQQIFQSVTEIHTSLLGAASAEKHERLDLLKLRTQWSMEALGTLATVVGTQPRQLILTAASKAVANRRCLRGDRDLSLCQIAEKDAVFQCLCANIASSAANILRRGSFPKKFSTYRYLAPINRDTGVMRDQFRRLIDTPRGEPAFHRTNTLMIAMRFGRARGDGHV